MQSIRRCCSGLTPHVGGLLRKLPTSFSEETSVRSKYASANRWPGASQPNCRRLMGLLNLTNLFAGLWRPIAAIIFTTCLCARSP
jgi:hypothetical protein